MIVDRDGIDPAHFRVARAGGEIIGVAAVHDGAGTT
jgi:mycothiol synthase